MYEEVVGIYRNKSPKGNPILEVKGEDLEVDVSGSVHFDQLREQLNSLCLGDLVGVLRIDSVDQPFLIRVIRRAG